MNRDSQLMTAQAQHVRALRIVDDPGPDSTLEAYRRQPTWRENPQDPVKIARSCQLETADLQSIVDASVAPAIMYSKRPVSSESSMSQRSTSASDLLSSLPADQLADVPALTPDDVESALAAGRRDRERENRAHRALINLPRIRFA